MASDRAERSRCRPHGSATSFEATGSGKIFDVRWFVARGECESAHRPVVALDATEQRLHVIGAGDRPECAHQPGANALPLPFIGDDDGDFSRTPIRFACVARFADDEDAAGMPDLGDQTDVKRSLYIDKGRQKAGSKFIEGA